MKPKRCYVCGNVFYTKYNQNILCQTCYERLNEECGEDWRTSEWWRELVRMNVAERRNDQRHKADRFVGWKGVSSSVEQSARAIVLRLYRSYGYGSRTITNILRNTYRLNMSRRWTANVLKQIKKAGIEPDEDAEFWRRWHAYLRSVGFIQYGQIDRNEPDYGDDDDDVDVSEDVHDALQTL